MADTDICPPDRCYGCWWYDSNSRGETVFMDLRTGHKYCVNCTAVLAEWEMDGTLADPDLCYAEWVAE